MRDQISILFLSQDDLLDGGNFDMKMAIRETRRVVHEYADGNILFPDKVSQIFSKHTQDRINCLPATIIKDKVCGMKWVSVFPGNPTNFGLQNLTACILLSSTINGYPIAFLEGTLCSNMRTAAVSSLAANHLAIDDPREIGFIGAGEQAKMHLIGMKTIFPSLQLCKVASRTLDSENRFISELSALFPDIEFVACHNSFKNATFNSDIIVTAISEQKPLLKPEWIKKGAFYCHVGGWEDDYGVALRASKIVCDDWASVKHRTQTISRMYQEGLLKDSDIYGDLHEIVTGQKAGRESTEEFIYFNAVGLSYVDVAIANRMYRTSVEKGIGSTLVLQSKQLFDHDLSRKYLVQ